MSDAHNSDQFIRQYSKLVYTAVERRLRGHGLTPGHEEVSDIQQEVLMSIWEDKKLDKIQNPDSIPYWVAIVSGNAAMQYMRRQRRMDPKKPVSLFDKIGETELMDTIPSSGLSPSEELDRAELSEKIDAAIDSLSVRQRLIIKLNLLHDKKYDEIADILKLPRGTVSNYINRAKEKLRQRLKEFG